MKTYSHWLDLKGACRYLIPNAHGKVGRRSLWHAAASLHGTLSCLPKSVRRWHGGNVRPPLRQDGPAGGRLSSCWQQGPLNPRRRRWSACHEPWSATGPSVVSPSVWTGSPTPLAAAPRAGFPPEVAIHVVRLACECPDRLGRRLSPWDGAALARQLIAEGMVTAIAGATGRRLLAAHQRKPWRYHVWLSPKPPRDAAFSATVSALSDLDTWPRHRDALVLAVDEKTSRQPRPRHTPTRPAQPQPLPNRYEHESRRAGALNLCAACDPRSGQGYGHCDARKRQRECIDFLDALDREIDK
jgi:hypothetical protein